MQGAYTSSSEVAFGRWPRRSIMYIFGSFPSASASATAAGGGWATRNEVTARFGDRLWTLSRLDDGTSVAVEEGDAIGTIGGLCGDVGTSGTSSTTTC